jgi:hypothetical protein
MQIMFDVPPLKSGAAWEVRIHLYGEAGLTGPESATTRGMLSIFGVPREGTLSGTKLQRGNIGGALLPTKGHFACRVVLQPIVHRFKLPPVVEDLADGLDGAATADSAGITGLLGPAKNKGVAGDSASLTGNLDPALEEGGAAADAAAAAAAAHHKVAPPEEDLL